MSFVDGSVFVGMWRDGAMEGEGRLSRPDGSIFRGSFARGLMNGQGKVTSANGEVKSGIWKDGALLSRNEAGQDGEVLLGTPLA